MYLFSPYDVERIYGKPFSYVDITAEYENLVNNPEISKSKIRARDPRERNQQTPAGNPVTTYIINIDTANRTNPVDGTIVMSNLCSEILQVQQPSLLNDKQEYEVLGTDISCNLGSTNIPNLMKSPDFGKSVETMVRALTYVTDHSSIEAVPTIKKRKRSSAHNRFGRHGAAHGCSRPIRCITVHRNQSNSRISTLCF